MPPPNSEVLCPLTGQKCEARSLVVTFQELGVSDAVIRERCEKLASHLLNDSVSSTGACRPDHCPVNSAAIQLLFKTTAEIEPPISEPARPGG